LVRSANYEALHHAFLFRVLLIPPYNNKYSPEHPVLDTTANMKLLIAYCCISYLVRRKKCYPA
jgi:hypothetical protein